MIYLNNNYCLKPHTRPYFIIVCWSARYSRDDGAAWWFSAHADSADFRPRIGLIGLLEIHLGANCSSRCCVRREQEKQRKSWAKRGTCPSRVASKVVKSSPK